MKPSRFEKAPAGRRAPENVGIRRVTAALTAVLVLGPCVSAAAIRTVTSLNDSGTGSLRDTIAAAAAGDTIVFGIPGPVLLTSGQIVIDKDIAITGPAGGITIDRQNSGNRILFVGNGTINGPTVVLTNLTIARGDNPFTAPIYENGGGIYNDNGRLTLQNCIVRDCSATDGGGLVNRPSGGGIYSNGTGATLTVTGCRFLDNVATLGGGAIANFGGLLTVIDSSFSGNTAQRGSGHIQNQRSAPSIIRQSTFTEGSGSGAVSHDEGDLEITNCTFYKNHPHGVAPAGVANSGALLLQHCTFMANEAGQDGTVRNIGDGSMSIRNTIIHNLSSSRSLVSQGTGTITSLGYNLVSDDGGGFLTSAGDQINADPMLDPAGLQDNGGPTKTIALMAGSPALDHGFSFGFTTDQHGRPRPWDLPAYPPAPGGDDCDIGACEATDATQASPIVVNTTHDHNDGVAGAADCTLREAIARADALGSGTQITFAPGLAGTLTLNRNLGPLTITGSLTLTGPGARILAVSANSEMRVLMFAASSVSTVSGLTLRDGFHGFGLLPGESGFGGGVLNAGSLTLNDCTLDHHYARGEQGPGMGGHGGAARGGGIYNEGSLILNRCTLRNCIAGGGHGTPDSNPFASGGNGGTAEGAAIYNRAGGSVAIENCTLFDNETSGGSGGNAHFAGNGGSGHGGAVFSAGQLIIVGSTVSGNTGLGGAGGVGSNFFNNGSSGFGSGGITAGAGSVSFGNTLCAGNTRNANAPSDVFGSFTSEGWNLIGSADGSTGFTHAADQSGTGAAPLEAKLGTLQNNGGACDTMHPQPDSPARDRGRRFDLSTDQRGLPRPVDDPVVANSAGGDGSDIGAVESDGPQPGPDFVVNTLADHDDGSASFLDCTLREAISAANAAPGANTVTFSPGLEGAIILTSAPGIAISDSVSITGPGARRLAVSGNNAMRVLSFSAGTNTLSRLTVRNGAVVGFESSDDLLGGGIFNQSILTVSDCTIAGNAVLGGEGWQGQGAATGGPGGGGFGGGIANAAGGSLTVLRCTFTGNTATGGSGGNRFRFGTGGPGGDGRGGGIFNAAGASLTIQNCTLHGNTATGGPGGSAPQGLGGKGGDGQGAAIFNLGTMSANSLTITANRWNPGAAGFGAGEESNGQPGSGAGALFSAAGSSSTVRNTISSSNTGTGDVFGAFNSGGFNLIADPSGATGFSAAGDQTFADPRLGPLQDNGGPTDTCALLTDSQALDRGHPGGVTHDQRLQLRPYDSPVLTNGSGSDGSDIGAVELRPPHTGPPEFILIEATAAGLLFCVQGTPFTLYQLHHGNLDTLFPAAGGPMTSDALGLVEFTDPAPLPGRRFYQVRESP